MILAIALAAFGSWALAGLVRRWASHPAMLDMPNHRSSHTIPTPKGGGLGIVLGFLLGLGAWLDSGGSLSPRALGWLAGALMVAVIGFVDDVRPLPAIPRLIVQLAGAALLAFAGVQPGEVPLLVALPLAFVWIALLTNIYNFMDGVDGLAASQAIVAGAAYFVAGTVLDNALVAVGGALLAAASLGFLPHNLPRAKLFMGDVSSTFLGFSFAGLALLGNLGVGGRQTPIELGVVALAPFLFDGAATLARRIVRGERWFEAHRSHYYQRLVQAGLTHGQVTALYTALAVFAAFVTYLVVIADAGVRPLLTVLAYLPMLGVVWLVNRMERAGARAVVSVGEES